MKNSKAGNLLRSLEEIESSQEAKDMRAQLLAIAKKIGAAPKGSAMADVLTDLEKLRVNLDNNPALKALYGLQAKLLFEEAEFKRTGKRVFFD